MTTYEIFAGYVLLGLCVTALFAALRWHREGQQWPDDSEPYGDASIYRRLP